MADVLARICALLAAQGGEKRRFRIITLHPLRNQADSDAHAVTPLPKANLAGPAQLPPPRNLGSRVRWCWSGKLCLARSVSA
jgi:hypothetical protein